MNHISNDFQEHVNDNDLFESYYENDIYEDDNSINSIFDIDMDCNNNKIEPQYKNILPKFVLTNDHICIIKLMKLVEDMQYPDDAIYKILIWAREAFLKRYQFNPEYKTRNGNLKCMKKTVARNEKFYPQSIDVALNSKFSIKVIYFDFVTQKLQLLQNNSLMIQENILIDLNNPSVMYKSSYNILSEALSSKVYQQIYVKEQQNHKIDLPLLVIPIFLWGDATHIDTYGRFKMKPWSFSPLVFNEKVRRE